ncbi:MAG: hypothetical protein C4341_09450 [Armatimonadota bacterium]
MRWESIWYPDSAVGQILSAALAPLGWLYAAGWRVYLGTYALGLKRRAHVSIPVFCAGNLEVGGSGKTPLAIALADLLEEMRLRPVVSVSGYGSPSSVGARLHAPGEALEAKTHGDEAALVRMKRPALPLIIGRDRVAAARLAVEAGAGSLVLDDGFQHLPLGRAGDLLVWQSAGTDAACPLGHYVSRRAARGELTHCWSRRVALRLPSMCRYFATDASSGDWLTLPRVSAWTQRRSESVCSR